MPDLPHLTVATIVCRHHRYLMVEEFDNGHLVLNQPAGHVEPGEDLLVAAIRETEEETGWRVVPQHLIGIFQYTSAVNAVSYTRLAFAAAPIEQLNITIDPDIASVHWLGNDVIARRRLRSPMVQACIDAYEAGVQLPLDVIHQL